MVGGVLLTQAFMLRKRLLAEKKKILAVVKAQSQSHSKPNFCVCPHFQAAADDAWLLMLPRRLRPKSHRGLLRGEASVY